MNDKTIWLAVAIIVGMMVEAAGASVRYYESESHTYTSLHLPQTKPAPSVGGAVEAHDELGEKLDEYMRRLEHLGFSGGLLVAKDAEVVLSKGYGMADRAQSIPFTDQTVFPIGSITKQFTGAAILKLEMMDLLHPEDPITKYFDGVPDDKTGITLHHLLTHSAGLPPALGYDFASIDREDYIRQALEAELSFEPGTSYAYSNVGYSLLAAIIEQVTRRSYGAFAREHLFDPAGMTKTGYDLARYEPDELAHGYRGDRDWGTFRDKTWADDGPYWHLRGNGGILSTLGDMYRWHQALEGNAVLSDDAKQTYYTPHVREGDGAPSFYGYGWVIQDTDRGQLIWHDGGNPYFSNDFRRYVDAGVVIYLTSNASEHRAPRLSGTLADIVFGDPYELPLESIETIDEAELKETPQGRRAQALLDLLAADRDAIQPFIDEHLSPRLLDQYAAETLADDFANDQREIGAVDIGRIRKIGPNELELTVQSNATGQWWELRVRTEPDPPHRLLGLGVVDTMPPPGVVPNGMNPPPESATGDWDVPDSPTGRAAAAFLDAVTQADEDAHRRFIETHFTSSFRDQFPMDEHLAQFQQMHASLGTDVEVVEARKTGANTARLKVRSASGEQYALSLELEPQPPHRIAGLRVQRDTP